MDRETLQVLTASDEAIFHSQALKGRLAPPPAATRTDETPVAYFAEDGDTYQQEPIKVEGPAELEPDTGRFRALDSDWGDE